MYGKHTSTTSVSLTPEDRAALDRLARGQHRQRSAALRALIQDADRKQREAEQEKAPAADT